jgi:hypothetical protein
VGRGPLTRGSQFCGVRGPVFRAAIPVATTGDQRHKPGEPYQSKQPLGHAVPFRLHQSLPASQNDLSRPSPPTNIACDTAMINPRGAVKKSARIDAAARGFGTGGNKLFCELSHEKDVVV